MVIYTSLLNRAPKTLSNLFKKLGHKTPLPFIQNRLLLESHHLLKYPDKTISEIGYELGFYDVQIFSHFFKIKKIFLQLNLSNLTKKGNIVYS